MAVDYNSIRQNSSVGFKPLTYQDYYNNAKTATDAHLATANAYDEFLNNINQMGLTKEEHDTYMKPFEDEVKTASSSLSKNGLAGTGGMQTLLNFKHYYSENIVPIQYAANVRRTVASKQADLIAQNPLLRFKTNAASAGLDKFMDDPNNISQYMKSIDLRNIINESDTAFKSIAEMRNGGVQMKYLGRGMLSTAQNYGLTPEEVALIQSGHADKINSDIGLAALTTIKKIYDSSGIDDTWDSTTQDEVLNTIKSRVGLGIGKTDVKAQSDPVWNFAKQKELQEDSQDFQLRMAGIKQQGQEDLATLRSELRGGTASGNTYKTGNDTTGHYNLSVNHMAGHIEGSNAKAGAFSQIAHWTVNKDGKSIVSINLTGTGVKSALLSDAHIYFDNKGNKLSRADAKREAVRKRDAWNSKHPNNKMSITEADFNKAYDKVVKSFDDSGLKSLKDFGGADMYNNVNAPTAVHVSSGDSADDQVKLANRITGFLQSDNSNKATNVYYYSYDKNGHIKLTERVKDVDRDYFIDADKKIQYNQLHSGGVNIIVEPGMRPSDNRVYLQFRDKHGKNAIIKILDEHYVGANANPAFNYAVYSADDMNTPRSKAYRIYKKGKSMGLTDKQIVGSKTFADNVINQRLSSIKASILESMTDKLTGNYN